MQKPARIVAATLMGIGLGSGASPVLAHKASNMQQSHQAQKSSPQSSHFSDKTIHKFAQAQDKARQISRKWLQKIRNAKNRKTKKQYRSRKNQEVAEAIQKTGLSIQQYNTIATAEPRNHKLANRIQNAQ